MSTATSANMPGKRKLPEEMSVPEIEKRIEELYQVSKEMEKGSNLRKRKLPEEMSAPEIEKRIKELDQNSEEMKKNCRELQALMFRLDSILTRDFKKPSMVFGRDPIWERKDAPSWAEVPVLVPANVFQDPLPPPYVPIASSAPPPVRLLVRPVPQRPRRIAITPTTIEGCKDRITELAKQAVLMGFRLERPRSLQYEVEGTIQSLEGKPTQQGLLNLLKNIRECYRKMKILEQLSLITKEKLFP